MAESPRTVSLTVKTEVGWTEPQTVRNHHHGEVFDIDRPRSESLESEAITAFNFVEVTTVNAEMAAATIFDPSKVVKKVVDEYLEEVRLFADGKTVTDYRLWLCANRITSYKTLYNRQGEDRPKIPQYEESCRLMYSNRTLADSPTLLSWLTGSSEMVALKSAAGGELEGTLPARADRWYQEPKAEEKTAQPDQQLPNIRRAEVLPPGIIPPALLPAPRVK